MPEYTLLTALALLIAILLDWQILRTGLVKTRRFWLTVLAILPGKLLLNGYLTAEPIVSYHKPYYLGIRVGSIPVEDFFYMLSIVLFVLSLWEKLKSLCLGRSS
jgi:lycopene cyclase domain-containing protein